MKTIVQFTMIIWLVAVFHSSGKAQQFPRISFIDPYWAQCNYNTANHNNPVNYADSSYYIPQMERLGITHSVTIGDSISLGTITSAINIFNANQTDTVTLHRQGVENLYEVGIPGGSQGIDLPTQGVAVNTEDPTGSGRFVYASSVACPSSIFHPTKMPSRSLH
jgi:hypothetical protein